MLKKFSEFILIVLSLTVLFLTTGCEVGLGSSVDTESPVLSITYPPAGAVVRGKFVLAGTCSDDKGVKSVVVSINGQPYEAMDAEVDNKKKQWKITINPDEVYIPAKTAGTEHSVSKLLDSTYVFDVIATDDSGRSSGVSSRSLSIDNTAPVFVMTAPAATKLSAASTYGSILKVTGSIAEEHSLAEMVLSVYKEENTQTPVATWKETDINISGSTSVTFARYLNGKTDELMNRYKAVYDENSENKTQGYFATISLSDNAGVWLTPVYKDSDTTAADSVGNVTTTVWFNDDIYGQDAAKGDLLSKNANPQFEIGDLRRILNGTFSKSTVTEQQLAAAKDILESAKTDTNSQLLAFKLNKDANPSYSVLGYGFTGNDVGINKASKAGKLTFKAEAGLDGTTFDPKTIKIFLFGPFEKEQFTDDLITSVYDKPAEYAAENAALQSVLYDGKTQYEGSSTTNWSISLILPDTVSANKNYLIAATGKDKDELDFMNDVNYGFTGVSAGYPPTVIITAPAEDTIRGLENAADVLTLKAKVSSDESVIKNAEYIVTVYDVNNGNAVLGTITGSRKIANPENLTEEFEFDLSNGTWNKAGDNITVDPRHPAEGVVYKYTMGFTGYDVTGLSSKASVNNTQIDAKAPVLSISSVSPVAKTEIADGVTVYSVNGKVTCNGNISDNNLKSVTIKVEDEHGHVQTRDLGTNTYFSESFYLESAGADGIFTDYFNDGDVITATLTAVDIAGNSSIQSSTVLDASAAFCHKYVYEKSTDIPTIKMNAEDSSVIAENQIEPNKNLFGVTSNNKLTGTITDDDAIGSLSIIVKKAGTEVGKKNFSDAQGKTTYSLNYELPSTEGKYTVELSVSDAHSDTKEHVNTVTKIYNIAVDAANPNLEFKTTNRGKAASGQEKTVSGTASDSSGLASLKRYAVPGNTDTSPEGDCEVENISVSSDDGSWTDTIAADLIGTSSGRRRYIATDIYGNKTSIDFIYFVDAIPPVIKGYTAPVNINAENVFDARKQFTISGKVFDKDDKNNNSEVASVKYLVLKSTDASPATTAVSYGAEESGVKYSDTSAWQTASFNASRNNDEEESYTFKANIDLTADDKTEGEYRIYFAAFDAAGNQSLANNQSVVKLTADKAEPVINVTVPATIKNGDSSTISGSLTESYLESFNVSYTVHSADTEKPAQTKEVKSESVDVSVGENGAWSWNLPCEGNFTSITFCAKDKAGNTSTKTISTTYDTVAPLVTYDKASGIFAGNDNGASEWFNSSTKKVQVVVGDWGTDGKSYSSGIDSVTYKLDEGENVSVAQGKRVTDSGAASSSGFYYSYSSTMEGLSDGQHTVKVCATDNAGNKCNEVVFTYKIDTKAPGVISATSDIDVITNKKTAAVRVKTSDTNDSLPVSGVKKILVGLAEGFAADKAVGSWESDGSGEPSAEIEKEIPVSLNNVPDGTYSLYIRAVDFAGNSSADTVAKTGSEAKTTFIIDRTPADVTIKSPAKNAVINKNTVFSGTVYDANASTSLPVLYYSETGAENSWNEAALIVENASNDGSNWSLTLDTTELNNTTAASDYYFYVSISDKAGNANTVPASENACKLSVDQNSDRPTVKFSNIKTNGSVIKAESVYGTISDDDGDAKGLWIIDSAKFDDMAAKTYPDYSTGEKLALAENNGWTKATLEGTSWSVEAKGICSWYLYVVDANGAAFFTKNDSQIARPYVQGYGESVVDGNNAIKFIVDTTAPEVTMYLASGKEQPAENSGLWSQVGGTYSGKSGSGTEKVWIRLVVKEDVGLAKNGDNYADPVVTLNGTKVEGLTATTKQNESNESEYTILLSAIDLSSGSYNEGQLQLMAKIYDQSNNLGQSGASVILDKSAPTVQILSPTTNLSDAVTSSISVKGLVQDQYSAISKLEWTIPKKDTAEVSQYWQTVDTTASWEIKFSSGTTDSADSLLFYAANESIYDVKEQGTEGVYKVPIWFRATDAINNSAVIKDKFVLADILSGKPKAWITSPEAGSTTSGNVTVYGGASDNISVGRVELAYSTTNSESADSWMKVVASGTNSWKYSIDTSGMTELFLKVRAYDEEEVPQTRDWTETRKIIIDSQVPVIKDLKVVQFGNGIIPDATTPYVTEREYISGMYISGKTVAEKGEWYLVGTVTDNESIGSITQVSQSSTVKTVHDIGKSDIKTNFSKKVSDAEYKLLIPLKTKNGNANLSGMYNFEIKAKDNGTGETSKTVIINLDSVAPAMYNTSNSSFEGAGTTGEFIKDTTLRLMSTSKMLGTGGTNSTVVNNNGYFTFGDTVTEEDSGLDYIAVYFERSSTSKIYDPLLASIALTKDSDITINSDGLPVMSVTSVTRSTEDSFTVSSWADNKNKHVRVGGLVKIGGIYALITKVSGNTVTFTPGVSKNHTSVEIVTAQIVNHLVTESDGGDSITNDDGDGMIESVNQLGTNYTWTASINSTNIPDGPIVVKVVAFDKAGNVTTGSIETNVTNNRPRIAKVFLGTDLNNSGTYEFRGQNKPVTSINESTANGKAYGEFCYYSCLNTITGEAQYNVRLESGKFKVKNGLAILPEFVGGNISDSDQMKYVMKIVSNDSADQLDSDIGTLNSVDKNLTSVIDKSAGGILDESKAGTYSYNGIKGKDYGGIIIGNDKISGVSGANHVLVTFWDATEQTVQGKTSQWAHLRIPFTNMSSDETAPKVKVEPFHWTSSTDNSIKAADDGTLEGHIELESDLTAEIRTEFGDTDTLKKPKVSGKIKITGIAYDENLLGSLTAEFGVSGSTVSVTSEYSNGNWSSPASSGALVSFTVEDTDLSQEGHSVAWTAVVDTEKVSGFAAKNVEFSVQAKDAAATAHYSTVGTTQTAKDNQTGYYKMDVVPYVKEIVTRLSAFNSGNPSVYARTAKGAYPVKEGEVIRFVGYNLGTNTAKVTIPGMSATTLKGGTVNGSTVSNTLTLTASSSGVSGAKSGDVVLTVSGIKALNNINKNDAVGSFDGVNVNYKNSYNRQPNGLNNNELTDDLSLDVWQFKDAARPVNGGAERVTMKINPKTGIPGFSYANSVLYFNMPAYNGDQDEGDWGANKTISGKQYSQIPVGMNYGGFSHNSFCFDDYGYSYGAAMCTDTQDKDSSAFFQFFSREAPIPYNKFDQNMNYNNCANASRIDMSTIDLSGNGSNYQTNINRIQSISMDTSYSGGTAAPTTSNPVYVYMAYFDDITKQVRFRWGTVGNYTDNIDGKANGKNSGYDSTDFTSRIDKAYGLNDVIDSKYTGFAEKAKSDGGGRPNAGTNTDSFVQFSYNKNGGLPIQVIAQSTVQSTGTVRAAYNQSTTFGAGNSVAMCIVGKTTASPKAVVFWSDGMKLYMAYNENPTTSNTWTNKLVDSNGGSNVKCVADNDGGIHVAYYTTNGGNLKYAYFTTYNDGTPAIVTVDANGAVGTKCTIDVAKVGGNWVPYISYQMIGGVSTYNAKVAYRTDFTSETFEGADMNDYYTGKWEISIVPTSTLLKDDTINVGVWRDSSGNAKAFTSAPYWKSSDVLKYGGTAGSSDFETVSNGTMNVGSPTIVKGNNTANPIIGYGVESGAIEIGQKK